MKVYNANGELLTIDSLIKDLTASIVSQLVNMGVITISAAQWGYLGTMTRPALGGDATAGRTLRASWMHIKDGTNANTLKCSVGNNWNGDVIAETDNIVKNGTTGHFTLNSTGTTLEIEATGLAGNVVFAQAVVAANLSGERIHQNTVAKTNKIRIVMFDDTGLQDITVLVNTGEVDLNILYMTDA